MNPSSRWYSSAVFHNNSYLQQIGRWVKTRASPPSRPFAPSAIEFLRLGAGTVVVGEGPGHQRDTYLVVIENGLDAQLRSQHIRFVDLDRDESAKVSTANFTDSIIFGYRKQYWHPILSSRMPKIKAHHWAGVTLSMKNMFGVVPGTKYGWPKNILHW